MPRFTCLAVALLASLATSASAQQPQEPTLPQGSQEQLEPNQIRDDEPRQVLLQEMNGPPPLASVSGFTDDYRVGPGDVLDIQVIGHEDLRQNLHVSNSGEISMSMIDLIKVEDMTTFEIEDEIARRLREADLVRQPEVLVSVSDYQAKPIYVMGAVTVPGQFIMSQTLTVADAILMAGGLRFNAGDEALLHRRSSSTTGELSPSDLAANPGAERPGVQVVKIDLTPIKEGRFNETSIPLRRGDVLVVPDRVLNQFFVVGEVLDPRNFLYTPGKVLMASQAISWAGGPTPTAKMSEGMLVRFDEHGTRTEQKVDWGAILDGRQQDFPIQSDDIIFVPGSAIKTITHGLLLLTSNMVQSASFRIARSYQMPEPPDPPSRPQPQQ